MTNVHRGRRRSLPVEQLEDRIVPSLAPISLIDPSRFGLAALGTSSNISMSDDGQVIAFQSDAPDLVTNDFNARTDVFVYFPATGRLELVSVNGSGQSGNFESTDPEVSPDGRYVLFRTTANDIVPGASGFAPQLAARDLQTHTTIVISADDAGNPGNAPSAAGWWSGDSTKVVFQTFASNFSLIDANRQEDVYLRDLTAGTTSLISVNRDGTASGDNRSYAPQISRDGNHIAFLSFAEDLIENDLTNIEDVYVRDLTTGKTELITIDSTGTRQPTVHSGMTEDAISADGRYVLFVSSDVNFAGVPIFNGNNLYVRDRIAGTTTLVSVNADGSAGVGGFSGRITPDGKYIAFISNGTGLDPTVNDTNNTFDAFRRDMVNGVTELVTINRAGDNGGDGLTVVPTISDDGRWIAFFSEAGNLSADPDGNQNQANSLNRRDLFIRDMLSGITTNVSSGGNDLSQLYAVSADFQTFAFESLADNLVAGDRNQRQDVIVHDLDDGIVALASRRDPSFPLEQLGGGGVFSATPDGRYVAFQAGPSADLVPGITYTGFQTGVSYVHDRQTGETQLVDLTPDPTVSGGGFNPLITPDGRFVAFWSRVPTGGSQPLVDDISFEGNFFWGRDVYLRDLSTGVTQLVSVDPSETRSNNGQKVFSTLEHAISDDGRYIAFTSISSNLIDGLSNPDEQIAIYQRDMWAGKTLLVSHNLTNDGTINADSYHLSMSADGRYITFTSKADNLVANDGNGKADVFRWDRDTDSITLVSVNAAGTAAGNDHSGEGNGFRPVMTPDGRYVAFASRANNLTTLDNNDRTDIFVRDLETDVTILASVNQQGSNGGNQDSLYPRLSHDGQKLVFVSRATDLTDIPTSSILQAYVRDLQIGTTQLVSINAGHTTGGNDQVLVTSNIDDAPTISPDGRYVVFQSEATDLTVDFIDNNGPNAPDVFLRDLDAGMTRLVSYTESGTKGAAAASVSFRYLFVGSGHTEVIFDSAADDLFPGDRTGGADVFAFTVASSGAIQGSVSQTMGGEPLPGIAVYLDHNQNGQPDVGEPRRLTDDQGGYAFTNLPAGNYQVGVVLPDGFESSGPESLTVMLPTDESIRTDQDFAATAAKADLGAVNLHAPTEVAAGAPFRVTWVTRNFARQAIPGDWQEAVYLSTDRVLDGSDVRIGMLAHTGGLGALASIARSETVVPPAGLIGTFYVFVQVDTRNQVIADTHRTNNLAFRFDPTILSIPELTFASPINDTFTGVNQDRYYQIEVQPGTSVRLTLDSQAIAGGTELYAAFGVLPTPFTFDHTAREFAQPDQILTIPLTRPGTYYVLARSRFGVASIAPFTLSAEDTSLEIDAITPDRGPASGRVTVEVRGTGFTFHSLATLVRGNTTLEASMIDFRDPSLLYATFDLTGLVAGAFDLQLTMEDRTETLANAFTVEPPSVSENPLQLFMVTPEFVRVGRVGKAAVEYINTSTTDIPAPLLRVEANTARLRLAGRSEFLGGSLTFLGIAPDGPAGVLRPGQRGRVEFEFLTTGLEDIDFQLSTTKEEATIDWNRLKNTLRPLQIPTDAWEAIYANFVMEAGTTSGEYQALLGEYANSLSAGGIRTPDTQRLVGMALASADATYITSPLLPSVDTNVSVPGLSLSFVRAYQQSILGRYTLGRFGRGWTHNWDLEAITLDNGDVILQEGPAQTRFLLQEDGSYQSAPNDPTRLTRAAGVLTRTTMDGTDTRFLENGQLAFIQDPNGNRVTATYDGQGRLTTLNHSSGGSIQLTYNQHGTIASLADSEGRSTSYAYDASGEHLTSYTNAFGTHRYTYVSDQGLQREHALASVQLSDGTNMSFEYDTEGRLIRDERNEGLARKHYVYHPTGEISVTNAGGETTSILLGDSGELLRLSDPLGQNSYYGYDENGSLTSMTFASGTVIELTNDSFGQITSIRDPLGRDTSFTYDNRGNLTSFHDGVGRTTLLSYDQRNNLIQVTRPDSANSTFGRDAVGSVTSATDARGNTVTFETNSAGQITRRIGSDGDIITYEYNSRAQLIRMTDASGVTEIDYFPNGSLKTINYPNDRSLTYQYDTAGRRTQVVHQDGFTLNYSYDALGRLELVRDDTNASLVQYMYDKTGRLTREEKGNGTVTTYHYNPDSQLVQIAHFQPGEQDPNLLIRYAYDSLGRRTEMTTPEGRTLYEYDVVGQLSSIVLPDGRSIAYTYDAAGNRLSVVDSEFGTSSYEYDEEYRLIATNTSIYTYDADGNLRSQTTGAGTTEYIFNDNRQLVQIHGPNINIIYEYDGFGNLRAVTSDGVRTEYLIDPILVDNLAAVYTPDGEKLVQYLSGIGVIGHVISGQPAFYDFDGSGSTVGISGPEGDYVGRYSYLPFGETLETVPASPYDLTYHGKWGVLPGPNGLSLAGARHYDSASGRFISPDPLLIPSGTTPYHYVFNNPISYTDPTGEFFNLPNPDVLGPWDPNVKGPRYWDPFGINQGDPCNHTIDLRHYEAAREMAKTFNPITQIPGFNSLPSQTRAAFFPGVFLGFVAANIAGLGVEIVQAINEGGIDLNDCNRSAFHWQDFVSNAMGALAGATGFDFYEKTKSRPRNGFDPNDITGPAGVGDDRYIHLDQTLPYTIRFENLASATAPAQEVFVTHRLDADLDLATFQLGDLGFADIAIEVPDGLQSFVTSVDTENTNGTPLRVDITAELNIETRTVSWTFLSIDPNTGLFPEGVFDGFLPPNLDPGEGEGFVSYTIRALSDRATNTTIDQQASIVFDTNDPIVTNVYTNTIDRDAPSSSVNPLPTTTTDTTFTVSWAGTDLGSGILHYDVFVAVDDGAFTQWLDNTTTTSADFQGEIGHTYAFFSVASDAVGWTQPTPGEAQALTEIVPDVPPPGPPMTPPTPPMLPPGPPTTPPTVPPMVPPTPPVTPPPLPPASTLPQPFLVGAGSGGGPIVVAYQPDGSERSRFPVFEAGFSGGVRTATASLNLDDVPDLLVGTGPGSSTLVIALDGDTGDELFRVPPFEASFRGGIFLAASDLDGDGIDDIAISPDEGGGPRVRILSGADRSTIADFFGIEDPNFRGGARIALADINGDATPDLLVAAGFGGGPRLAVFDGASLRPGQTPRKLAPDFFVFEQSLRNGVFIAGGDLDGDGFAEVIAGGGPGGGPRVFALSGSELLNGRQTTVANFFAGDIANRGGIRLTTKHLDQNRQADLVVGSGTGAGATVTAYSGADLNPEVNPEPLFFLDVFRPAPFGGVFVG